MTSCRKCRLFTSESWSIGLRTVWRAHQRNTHKARGSSLPQGRSEWHMVTTKEAQTYPTTTKIQLAKCGWSTGTTRLFKESGSAWVWKPTKQTTCEPRPHGHHPRQLRKNGFTGLRLGRQGPIIEVGTEALLMKNFLGINWEGPNKNWKIRKCCDTFLTIWLFNIAMENPL